MKTYVALALAPTVALIGAFLQSSVAAQQSRVSAPPTPYTQTFVRDPKNGFRSVLLSHGRLHRELSRSW